MGGGKFRVFDVPASRTSMYAASSGAGLTTLYPVHNLELNEVQAEVLTRELHSIIQNDRYPLSPRIVALKEILGQLRPEPDRPATLPPRRHYEPPGKGRYAPRRG